MYDQYNIELRYDKDIFKTIKKVLKFDGFLILDKNFAKNDVKITPLKLSLAIEGWQIYVDIKISFLDFPFKIFSP